MYQLCVLQIIKQCAAASFVCSSFNLVFCLQ